MRRSDEVLRPARTGERKADRTQIDFDNVGIVGRGLWIEPQAGRARIIFDQLDSRCVPPGFPQIAQRRRVDREIACRRSIFGRHVRDNRPVAGRQCRNPRTEILHEASGQLDLAQAVSHDQGKVGRGDALAQSAGQANADDFRNAHHDRHAEHDALGLQPADAPAEHADSVDHGRMAVGTDQRIGHCPVHTVLFPVGDDRRQPFEVYRVHDPCAGRVHGKAVECVRRPFHEAVALGIALHFARHVARARIGAAENVDRKTVVGRYVHGQYGIEQRRIAAGLGKSGPCGGNVDERRTARGVVHQHATRRECDFGIASAARDPAVDQRGRFLVSAAVTQQILDQDAMDDGQGLESECPEVDDRIVRATAAEVAGRYHARGQPLGRSHTKLPACRLSPPL